MTTTAANLKSAQSGSPWDGIFRKSHKRYEFKIVFCLKMCCCENETKKRGVRTQSSMSTFL